jgi:hypothetical protein
LARLGSPDARPESVAALESFRKLSGSSEQATRTLIALGLVTPDTQVQ